MPSDEEPRRRPRLSRCRSRVEGNASQLTLAGYARCPPPIIAAHQCLRPRHHPRRPANRLNRPLAPAAEKVQQTPNRWYPAPKSSGRREPSKNRCLRRTRTGTPQYRYCNAGASGLLAQSAQLLLAPLSAPHQAGRQRSPNTHRNARHLQHLSRAICAMTVREKP